MRGLSRRQMMTKRMTKRRRTTASEEARSVKEANDDIIIRDATKDAHKAIHEYNKESSSKVQEICQNVPVVIPGSESGVNANESSDKTKQPQEHSDNQAVDNHSSETRSGKLDQSTCIAGLVPHNCVVSEDEALMSEDVLSIDFTVGYREEQSPVSGEGRVGLEANASEPGEKNLANVMSTGLHFKSLHHDIDIIAEEADKDVLPTASPIEEHGEKYAVSPVAVEKSVSACESAENPLTGIFSNDLHTKHLQHDGDLLTKETGEASGAAPPISESDTNPEIQCKAEESIRAADLGKCPSLGNNRNLYLTSLHLEGADDDCILPVLNADKGCSSDGRPSSFGLEPMFAEGCKESYSKNIENIAVEIVGENKPSAPVTLGFYAGSVCLGDEDVQPSGCDADKNLDVDQGAAGEGIGNPSVTPDYKLEVRSEEAACRMKNYTGTCSDPRHLPMELVSPYSEGSEGIGNPSVTPDYKLEVRSEEAACRVKNYTGTYSDPRHLPMELVSPYSEESEDEKLNPELTGETDTSGILRNESVLSNTALLPKDGHTICCQELELSNGLSIFKFAEGSAIRQYVSVSGSGPCQQDQGIS